MPRAHVTRLHVNVIKWKHFPCYWTFVWVSTGTIHQSPVDSLKKASDAELWCFLCAWINGWANNRGAADFRRHRADFDVTLMYQVNSLVSGILAVLSNTQFSNTFKSLFSEALPVKLHTDLCQGASFKLKMFQFVALWCQAASHSLNQCWGSFVTPHRQSVTMRQCIKAKTLTKEADTLCSAKIRKRAQHWCYIRVPL